MAQSPQPNAGSQGPEGQIPEGQAATGPDTHAIIAIVIAAVSILGAIVAARAAWEAQDATLLERRHVQALMLREMRELDLQGRVDHDFRLSALYTAHELQAQRLQEEARELRQSQPDQAAWLDLRAQEERALRRAVQPFFRIEYPSEENGVLAYNKTRILAQRLAADTELREIKVDLRETEARLAEAHERTWLLEACVAILVLSLFFLTLALADIGGRQWRGPLAGAGAGFAAVGVATWLLIEGGWVAGLFLEAAGH